MKLNINRERTAAFKKILFKIMLAAAALLLISCNAAPPAAAPPALATQSEQPAQSAQPTQNAQPTQSAQSAAPIATPALGSLHMYFLDVGDADAIICVSPEGYVMVVDTGLEDTYKTLSSALSGLGISKIDCLVLTHGHSDHIGGAKRLLSDLGVDAIYMTDSGYESDGLSELKQYMASRSLRAATAAAGVSFDFGTVKAEFLAPIAGKSYEDENERSAVLRLKYKNRTYLLMGDALKATEQDMAEAYPGALACDVLKCGHHGEKDASKKRFLELTKPTYAIISAGAQSDHADEKVIERLGEAGAEVFITKTQGTIYLRQTEEQIEIKALGK